MQKCIIAGAIAAATVTPFTVQAQSNVTIYGLVDLNIAHESAGDLHRTGVDHGELNGSRWGLKGSEALGGGLKAIFTLESGFDPSTGVSEQGGRLFGRQSLVGLEGSWGRVTLGRQYSPAFVGLDPFDATGGADRSPGLLTRKTGGIKPAYETRFDNMVKYRSPSLGGLEVDVGYWFGEKNNSGGKAAKEGNGLGITGLYKRGPLVASLTTQSVFRDATGGRVRTSGGGLSYDFGVMKAYLAYSRDSESGTQGSGKARTYDLGAEFRASDKDTVAVSYANRNESNDVAAEDAYGWSAYYMHDVSKRTTLYAGYSTLNNKGNANYAIGNISPAAGDDPRVVMAGMRHRF